MIERQTESSLEVHRSLLLSIRHKREQKSNGRMLSGENGTSGALSTPLDSRVNNVNNVVGNEKENEEKREEKQEGPFTAADLERSESGITSSSEIARLKFMNTFSSSPAPTRLPIAMDNASMNTAFASSNSKRSLSSSSRRNTSPSLSPRLMHSPTSPRSTPLQRGNNNVFPGLSSGKSDQFYHHVTITPLAYIPGCRVRKYLGQINLHFIRESWTVKESGGLGNFYHEVLMHAQALCRAHIVAQGGNALTSFRLKPHESGGKMYRNQVYCLLSVAGDMCLVEESPFGSVAKDLTIAASVEENGLYT